MRGCYLAVRTNRDVEDSVVVIQTGGKQYRVEQGSIIEVEKLEAAPGALVVLDHVLMAQSAQGAWQVGTPFLTNIKVEAEVVEQARDKKIIVFKKKRRQNYRRKKGHRQHYTVLKIQSIQAA